MTLVESLLEGYGFAGYADTSGDSSLSKIQEAAVSFIYTGSEILQECMTEDITGQAMVVAEGVDPVPLLEGAVANFFKKMWEAIKKFFTNLKNWIAGVFKKIKDKFTAWRNSKKKKKLEEELKKHDGDEKIAPEDPDSVTPPSIPAAMVGIVDKTSQKANAELTGDSYPIIEFNIEGGIEECGKMLDHVSSLLSYARQLCSVSVGDMEASLTKNAGNVDIMKEDNPLEAWKEKAHKQIGFDSSNVEDKVYEAFNAKKVTRVGLTVDMVYTILRDAERLAEPISKAEKSMEDVMDEIKGIEDEMKKRSSEVKSDNIPQDVLKYFQVINGVVTYTTTQLGLKIVTTETAVLRYYQDQADGVVNYATESLKLPIEKTAA